MSLRTESDYYAYRGFDRANAEKVLGYYVDRFPNGRVLELACGPGVFLSLLRDVGVETVGVDLDPGMVEEAAKDGHAVVLADAVDYLKDAPDDSFDGVFAAHFIEHLSAEVAQEVFNQTQRVLKPGGNAVFVVPSAECYPVLTVDFWRDPTHVRFYDAMALGFFAEQAGLQVVEFGPNPENHPGPPDWLVMGPPDPIFPVAEEINRTMDQLISDAHQREAARRQQLDEAGTGAGGRLKRALANAAHRELDGAAPLQEQLNSLRSLLLGLDRNVQHLQHEMGRQAEMYRALVRTLYPPNEVFLMARKGE